MSQARLPGLRAVLLLIGLAVAGAALAEPAGQNGRADSFAGQVAIITGSSHGLGMALAEAAAARGMKLVLADISPAPSEAFAERLRAAGGAAVVVAVDLAVAAERPRVIAAAEAAFGGVDVLFNNAGYNYMTPLELHDLEMAHRLFEVNYWAYVDLAQRAAAIMKTRGGGYIVNTASILGHRPAGPGMGVYSASKHALVGMFQAVAQELAPDGIKVRVASPGGMRTRISRDSVGPWADGVRDRADDWEDPAIVAEDIFTMMTGESVVFFPGYVGRQ